MKKLSLIFKKLKKHPIKTISFIFILMLVYEALTDCGPCFKDKDYTFIEKIYNHLDEKGEFIKVSELFPERWEIVCALYSPDSTEPDIYAASRYADEPAKAKLLNDRAFYLTGYREGEAVVFKLNKNNLKIFRYGLPDPKMAPLGIHPRNKCLKRADAYFYLERLRELPIKDEVQLYKYIKLLSERELRDAK